MAQIYAMVGLLPHNHPYLDPANKGRFGIRHVIAEAANRLELNRNNIDKILVFVVLLAGTVLLFAQLVLLGAAFFFGAAWAGPIPIANLFDTLNPQTDIAFNILTLVFGVPDLYCSASAPGTCADASAGAGIYATAGPVPYPIHLGLHDLFSFYSGGILLIGTLIFLYHIVVIVAETAVTGSPFGQRFQNVWVPIRLVVALGLLVPINWGYNSGQYLALYAAKLGSSIATNGWLRYNNTILAHPMFGGAGTGANPIGERETLLGVPKPPSVSKLVEAMSIIHTCAYSYWHTQIPNPLHGTPAPRAYGSGAHHYAGGPAPVGVPIRPYMIKTAPNGYNANLVEEWTDSTPFQDALDFYGDGNIIIRFGERVTSDPSKYTGGVKPYCGDIVIPISSINRPATVGAGGPDDIHAAYYQYVRELWFDGGGYSTDLRHGAIFFYENTLRSSTSSDRTCDCGGGSISGCGTAGLPDDSTFGVGSIRHCDVGFPTKLWSETTVDALQGTANTMLINAWQDHIPNMGIEIETAILDRGWAGAGMWFNRLAQINGSFQAAVNSVPEIRLYPIVMEEVRKVLLQTDPSMVGIKQFSPNTSDGSPVALANGQQDTDRARAMYRTYQHWNEDGRAGGNVENEVVYNIFMDAINMIFGLDGVFDIRGANVHTHPLVQLILVGKGMVDSTIRNIGASTATSFAGGVAAAAGNQAGASIMEAISSFLFSTAFLGLTAGLVLYYVVPFLPFVYFFFAVGVWVKSIFEAMVGIPLWALAHLRLDGDGLPGESAANGYFLIFEIGIRPILTLFGLIAAIAIFGAQVRVLHFIWDMVVENTAGFNDNPEVGAGVFATSYYDLGAITPRDGLKRGVIDQFFYTIIYTIIVYMLATASFKLIDMIPDNILRWGGIGVSSFGDQQEDALQGLQRYVAMGGMVQGQQLGQGVTQAAQGLGRAGGSALGLGGSVGRAAGG
ncbi:MAG: DotA/TraY family protein [Alphaproteobacteria bacterium]